MEDKNVIVIVMVVLILAMPLFLFSFDMETPERGTSEINYSIFVTPDRIRPNITPNYEAQQLMAQRIMDNMELNITNVTYWVYTNPSGSEVRWSYEPEHWDNLVALGNNRTDIIIESIIDTERIIGLFHCYPDYCMWNDIRFDGLA